MNLLNFIIIRLLYTENCLPYIRLDLGADRQSRKEKEISLNSRMSLDHQIFTCCNYKNENLLKL